MPAAEILRDAYGTDLTSIRNAELATTMCRATRVRLNGLLLATREGARPIPMCTANSAPLCPLGAIRHGTGLSKLRGGNAVLLSATHAIRSSILRSLLATAGLAPPAAAVADALRVPSPRGDLAAYNLATESTAMADAILRGVSRRLRASLELTPLPATVRLAELRSVMAEMLAIRGLALVAGAVLCADPLLVGGAYAPLHLAPVTTTVGSAEGGAAGGASRASRGAAPLAAAVHATMLVPADRGLIATRNAAGGFHLVDAAETLLVLRGSVAILDGATNSTSVLHAKTRCATCCGLATFVLASLATAMRTAKLRRQHLALRAPGILAPRRAAVLAAIPGGPIGLPLAPRCRASLDPAMGRAMRLAAASLLDATAHQAMHLDPAILPAATMDFAEAHLTLRLVVTLLPLAHAVGLALADGALRHLKN